MIQVLIVDDERITGQCLQQQIDWAKLGCAVPAVCYDGNQALHIIKETPPDIVITDVRMPGMDGITLCKLLHERYPSITVFIISAYEDFEVAQQAMQYNVRGYVLKPLNRTGLEKVEDLVSSALTNQQKQKFRTALLANTMQLHLDEILVTRDMAGLDAVLEMTARFEGDPLAENLTLWMNLVSPVVRNGTAGLERMRYLEEKQIYEQIRRLTFRERLRFVREKYLDAMREEPDSHSSNVVYAVQKVVDAEFASKDLNVTKLAERFHISPSYLGSLYTQATGMGLAEYIRDKRLNYACEQLRTGNKSISAIAQESGFSNVNYFTKVFRKNLGTPPAEYRNQFRERN